MIWSAPRLRSVRVGCGCGAADGLGMRCLDRWSDTAGTMPGSPGKLMQPDRPFHDPDQSPWPQPAAAAGPDGRTEQRRGERGGNWCRRRDSNPRPRLYESLALPTELRGLIAGPAPVDPGGWRAENTDLGGTWQAANPAKVGPGQAGAKDTAKDTGGFHGWPQLTRFTAVFCPFRPTKSA